jgi:hypothetical protein
MKKEKKCKKTETFMETLERELKEKETEASKKLSKAIKSMADIPITNSPIIQKNIILEDMGFTFGQCIHKVMYDSQESEIDIEETLKSLIIHSAKLLSYLKNNKDEK